MMTISYAAADKAAVNTGSEKGSEKLAERRRALGRGLESLLPGPRVVPAASSSPSAPLSGARPETTASTQAVEAGISVAPPAPVVDELRASADRQQPLELAL